MVRFIQLHKLKLIALSKKVRESWKSKENYFQKRRIGCQHLSIDYYPFYGEVIFGCKDYNCKHEVRIRNSDHQYCPFKS